MSYYQLKSQSGSRGTAGTTAELLLSNKNLNFAHIEQSNYGNSSNPNRRVIGSFGGVQSRLRYQNLQM